MSKPGLALALVLIALFFTGCAKDIQYVNLQPLVSFDKQEHLFAQSDLKKIPLKIGLFLPEEFKRKMPLTEKDKEIWTWFFRAGLMPVFENITLIDKAWKEKKPYEHDLVVQPELWTWWWSGDHCALGFKLLFFDNNGAELFSVKAEGRSTTATYDVPFIGETNYDRVMAQAMDDLMIKLQHMIIQKKEDMLGSLKK